MDIKARLRPFYIAKMLYEQTDENHYLTIAQIINQLETNYGISTTRGTVGDDIKVIQEYGIEIEVEQSTQKRFFVIGRRFEDPELKSLIDAVESARFISKKKSTDLVQKIASLSSKPNSENLIRNVDVENRIKTDNEKVYYIMDALNEAINRGRKVSFQYFSYNVQKKQVIKNGGFTYIFSPYKLIWNGDYYYAVGYSEKHQGVGSFRVDRIVRSPRILEEQAVPPPDMFDMNVYLSSMFHMYNGERKLVELICENELMDAIIDKFGKKVKVFPYDPTSFRIVTNTSVGRVFYSWIFGFGGRVSILSPDDVKEEYAKMVRDVAAVLA